LVLYSFLIVIVLVNVNFYIVWFLIEIIFLFFLLYIITIETKRVGLIIYYFFQRFLSLILFIVVFLILTKLIFIILCAKLGLFPFFYWVVVVSIKVGILGNIFILSLQKLPVFWIFWLLSERSLIILFLFCYLGIILVVINLSLVVDIWLLLVYSSIANTGILLISRVGSYYIISILLYLIVISAIIFLILKRNNYAEILIIVLLFLVIPPFVLFFIKFYIVISLDSLLKLSFFIFIFDVFVLFYYFRFIFIKFILFDRRVLIYFINYLILILILLLRNCVALNTFY
jgi:hypothetical protein